MLREASAHGFIALLILAYCSCVLFIVKNIGCDKNDAVSRALRARTTWQRGVIVGHMRGRDMVDLDKSPVRQADHHARLARHSAQRFGQLGNGETVSHYCNLPSVI